MLMMIKGNTTGEVCVLDYRPEGDAKQTRSAWIPANWYDAPLEDFNLDYDADDIDPNDGNWTILRQDEE